MRYLLILSILTSLLCGNGYSQTQTENTIFNTNVKKGEPAKIIFNTANYDTKTIGLFKDELVLFKEKVLIAHFNEDTSLFTIVYNERMQIESFIYIFNKYNIDYSKNGDNPSHSTK